MGEAARIQAHRGPGGTLGAPMTTRPGLAAMGCVLLPDSFNPRGVREVCTMSDRPVRPGYERARDVYGALAWVQAQPWARADRVALLGWSNGGTATLWAVGARSPARPPDLAHDFR